MFDKGTKDYSLVNIMLIDLSIFMVKIELVILIVVVVLMLVEIWPLIVEILPSSTQHNSIFNFNFS